MNEIGRSAEKCLAAAAKFGQVILITNSDDGWVHYSCKRYIPNLLPALNKYRIVSARTEYESFYPGSPLCWKAACFAHEVNETFMDLEIKRNRLNELYTNKRAAATTDTADHSMGVHSHSHSHSTSHSSMGLGPTSPTTAFDSFNSTDDSSDDSRDERKSRLLKHRPKSSMGGTSTSTSTSRDAIREVISFGDSMEERTAVKIVSKLLTAMPKSVMFISSPTPEQLIGQLSMLENHMKYICTARRKEKHDQGCRVQSTQGQFLQDHPMGNSVSRMKRVSGSDRCYDETFSA